LVGIHTSKTKIFEKPGMKLNDFVGVCKDSMAKKGKSLPILVDVEAFKERQNPEIDRELDL